MNRQLLSLAALSCAIALLLGASGCDPAGPTFVDDGATYTLEDVSTALEGVRSGVLADTPASDAERLRHEALVGLRGDGDAAAAAADLITRTFPPTTRAVPVYVERATVDGASALLVIEAVGPADGNLGDERLWVIGEDGSVLYSTTR